MPKTPTQLLQECRDSLAQARNQLEHYEGIAEELQDVREELAQARVDAGKDVSVSEAERRRFREQLREAETERDAWSRRAINAENELANNKITLYELRTFLADKECILPQIKRIIG